MLRVHTLAPLTRAAVTRQWAHYSLMALALLSPSTVTAAFLQGPQVQAKPYVHIAFASSERVVQKGQVDRNGDCLFPIDHSFAPGDLPEGYSFVSVQRELDPINCVELSDQGLVAISDLPTVPLGPAEVLSAPIRQLRQGFLRGRRQMAEPPTYRAHIQVYYTDAGNPIWDSIPALELFQPSTRQSLGAIELIWSPPSFCDPRFSTNGSARSRVHDEFQQPFWTRAQDRRVDLIAPSCDNRLTGRVEFRASHANSSNVGPIYNCDRFGGARADYQPLVVTGRSDGSMSTSGSFYRLLGPFNACTEYMTRIVVIGFGEMPYPDLISVSIPSIDGRAD